MFTDLSVKILDMTINIVSEKRCMLQHVLTLDIRMCSFCTQSDILRVLSFTARLLHSCRELEEDVVQLMLVAEHGAVRERNTFTRYTHPLEETQRFLSLHVREWGYLLSIPHI